MIGILIVVVIIMGVILVGPMSTKGDRKGRPQMVRDIDRSKDVACGSTRGALRTEISMLQIDNPRLTQADQAVVALMSKNRCPGGGIYVFDTDGSIRCTQHAAPSLATLTAMVRTPRPSAEDLARKVEPSPLIAGKPAG